MRSLGLPFVDEGVGPLDETVQVLGNGRGPLEEKRGATLLGLGRRCRRRAAPFSVFFLSYCPEDADAAAASPRRRLRLLWGRG